MKTNNTKIREYIIVKNDINNPVLKETMVCDWNGDLSYTVEDDKRKDGPIIDVISTDNGVIKLKVTPATVTIALFHAFIPFIVLS